MTEAEAPPEKYVSAECLPGALIDDKYRVDGIIGRGGVGVVVAATHLAIAQRVAIKMIRDDIPMQRELLDRFQREAQAAAMIRSEHVARVLDVGRLPTGRPYIVMELLEGEDLERVLVRGALPPALAVDLTMQACEALAEAHRSGIIHRDLKPANLFVTRRPDGALLIKLLDFGISKIQPLTAARSGRNVETTSIMGSPGYMAPEQMKSTRDVDARADVWSLGAVLYEMLTGRPAFAGANMIEILDAIAACDPVPASELQPGVPASLDYVLARCLTREPNARYGGVAALAMALQPFASPAGAGLAERIRRIAEEPAPAYVEPPFAALRSEPRPSSVTVVTPGRRAVSHRRMVAMAVGALGGLLVALAALFAVRSSARSAIGAAAPSIAAAVASPPAQLASASAPAAAPGGTTWGPVTSSSAPPVSPTPPPPSPAAPPPPAPAAAHASAPSAPQHRGTRPAAPVPAPDSPFGDRK